MADLRAFVTSLPQLCGSVPQCLAFKKLNPQSRNASTMQACTASCEFSRLCDACSHDCLRLKRPSCYALACVRLSTEWDLTFQKFTEKYQSLDDSQDAMGSSKLGHGGASSGVRWVGTIRPDKRRQRSAASTLPKLSCFSCAPGKHWWTGGCHPVH